MDLSRFKLDNPECLQLDFYQDGEAVYQSEIYEQESVYNTIYEVSGNISKDLKRKLNKNDFTIVSNNVDDSSLQFVSTQAEGHDNEIVHDNNDNLLSPELLSSYIDPLTLDYKFTFLVHGMQSFITGLESEYTNKISINILGFYNLEFYKKMILESNIAYEKKNFRDAFIFARIAYEGWLTSKVPTFLANKGWIKQYNSIYNKNPDRCFEQQLGFIRDILVHSNSNVDEVSKIIYPIDVKTQLKLIDISVKERGQVLKEWKSSSELANQNVFNI